MSHFLFVILALGTAAAASVNDKKFELPKDLLVGAGMAAVQSEGAWKEGGKSESMVDYALHSGKLQAAGFFRDPHLHDVAADSYHRYKEDVQAAAKLKLQLYRMSISWSRVLPEGDASKPNKEGVTYYHNLIDEILKYNMTPLVTMYHFDHPQIFEEKIKGWDDRRMVDKFEEFAEFLFNEYGSKVQLWTSFNEPNVYCSFFNTLIYLANGLPAESVLNKNLYPCIHNSILAHGVAQKAFRKGKHEGKVGFSVTTLLSRPATTSPEDVYASEAFNQMFTGILLNPVVHGDYPQVVKDIAGDMLPKFTDEEKEMLKDSADFIGLNLYFGLTAKHKDPSLPRREVSVPLSQLFKQANFIDVGYRSPTGESIDEFPMGMVAPDAMRSGLLWTWMTYGKPIMITENGIGDPNMTGIHDHRRAEYHSVFMRSMVSTIDDFGVKVLGYCAWSLVDDFEWRMGFTRQFGLVHVDYENGTLTRTLKDSSSFWLELAERRAVPYVAPSPSHAVAISAPAPLLVMLVVSLIAAFS